MRKFTNSLLGKLGYRIIRIKPVANARGHNAYLESDQLEAILRRFAQDQPKSSKLSDYTRLRAYLSDKRIGFFVELLNIVQQTGLSVTDKTIADMGCGTGFLLRLLAESDKPLKLVGYDTNQDMNALARAMCPDADIVDGDIHGLNTHFDVIFCTEVLEHLIDPGTALQILLQHLHVGGKLVLTVPDGRLNQEPAGEKRHDGTAYWGHVHFWSPESWLLFLHDVTAQLGDKRISIITGNLSSTENYAVLTRELA